MVRSLDTQGGLLNVAQNLRSAILSNPALQVAWLAQFVIIFAIFLPNLPILQLVFANNLLCPSPGS